MGKENKTIFRGRAPVGAGSVATLFSASLTQITHKDQLFYSHFWHMKYLYSPYF